MVNNFTDKCSSLHFGMELIWLSPFSSDLVTLLYQCICYSGLTVHCTEVIFVYGTTVVMTPFPLFNNSSWLQSCVQLIALGYGFVIWFIWKYMRPDYKSMPAFLKLLHMLSTPILLTISSVGSADALARVPRQGICHANVDQDSSIWILHREAGVNPYFLCLGQLLA